MRKTTGAAAMAGIAAGALLVGAPQANAANPGPDFTKLSAPESVVAGQMFRLKCKLRSSWAGGTATVREQNSTMNAKREVGPNGECTMRLKLFATGQRKIRVVVVEGLGAEKSKWVPIKVVPAS